MFYIKSKCEFMKIGGNKIKYNRKVLNESIRYLISFIIFI